MNKSRFDLLVFVRWLSLILIMFSLIVVFLLYKTDRSLWIDEAMLAYSLTSRGLNDLVSSALELNQSAPVLYLYLIKLITMIFGVSTFTLRIFSFFAYLVSLLMIYLIARDLFKLKMPLLVVAFSSNIRLLIYYANEFKPYISDVLVVLLVLYLYYLFIEKKLKFYQVIIIYMIFIWLSNPALFFIGGVLAYEFFSKLRTKEYQKLIVVFIGSVFILISFGSYYLFWLRIIAIDPFMSSFWIYYRFPLLVTSFSDLYKLLRLSGGLIADMGYNLVLIGMLIVTGVVVSFFKLSRYHNVIYISIFLTVLASYLGKYPFYERLMLFIYPILALYIFLALETLLDKAKPKQKKFLIMIVIVVFLSNYKTLLYLDKDNRYFAKNETKELIQYVDEHIKADEMLYVYYRAIPAYTFIITQDVYSIGGYDDNVIFGKGSLPDDLFEIDSVDFEKVLAYKKCYILIAHYEDEFIAEQLEMLDYHGEVELIKEVYDTPLYYFIVD